MPRLASRLYPFRLFLETGAARKRVFRARAETELTEVATRGTSSSRGTEVQSGDDVAGAEHSKGDSGGDDAVEDDQPERGAPGELVVSAGGERVQRAAG